MLENEQIIVDGENIITKITKAKAKVKSFSLKFHHLNQLEIDK